MAKIPKYFSVELLLLVAIAIAVLIRIINLGSREFWYDEVLSLLLSTGQKGLYKHPDDTPVVLTQYLGALNLPSEKGLGDILATGEKLLKGLVKEPHPPLFFIGQHLWLRLFGNSETAMRSLVAIFSIGAIGSAYGLGRCLLGYRGGLLLAALLGLNPYYLFHSLNVRMYGSLVFWVILTTWALFELIHLNNQNRSPQTESKILKSKWFWSVILIGAIAAGLMTFYYFACLLIVLAALMLLLDRRQWRQYALCFGGGVIINVPWTLWGTRQQLRNADLERFETASGWLETTLQHLQDFARTLGTHLILGDWVSILPPTLATIAGIGAIAILLACSLDLWQRQQRQILGIALMLGIVPLLLMLGMDVATGKFTLGFGWGRSVIFILPGCLFLLTVWIERAAGKWRKIAAIALLLLYLSISASDFSIRNRWMFHQIADIIEQNQKATTLIVMNSTAWGHVLRLAYYLPPTSSVMLLARPSDELAPVLQKTLVPDRDRYQRILWLDSARPVWGESSTTEEKNQLRQVLDGQFQLKKTQQLFGTRELDHFNLSLYERNPR
ncbi:putative membrane protein [Pleurocapsa sp. PCC 7327]|uniref:glycosyltransferase family 39 protein n=1 Tax=Pleurocapsa sp. PCC 7327 TaxID=118163 RepID=UPI00029FDC07|nr:glycosyltransferase family 39 protein [Pleurocapsa sp. PCC 7327]AFY76869.1 putative membrane protein [Pleurocapsa sp. PCC 7327]